MTTTDGRLESTLSSNSEIATCQTRLRTQSMMMNGFPSPTTIAALMLPLLTTPACLALQEGNRLDAQQISQLIDSRLGVRQQPPPPFADDSTVLRRMSLDLIGRIPTVSEVRSYLNDQDPRKRERTADRLMQSGAHARHIATFWRRVWVPQADTPEYAELADAFEAWLTQELRTHTAYNELVKQVLLWDAENQSVDRRDPASFYAANEQSPARLAASSTRAFLGINLDCAQCHDHPFARWSREQFWQTAAFFVRPTMDEDGVAKLPQVQVPDTKLVYQPKLLDGEEATWEAELNSQTLRQKLFRWIMTEDESYLARNAVNRVWGLLLGNALIEPVDDLSSELSNTGPQAELLEDLAQQLIQNQYDIELIIEGIVKSDAYRLASMSTRDDATESQRSTTITSPLHRDRATIRGLTGEQLYDSLLTAAGRSSERGGSSQQRQAFASQFFVPQVATAERSITQSLAMMNGAFVNGLSLTDNNPMLDSILASPFMNEEEQVDTVFVAVLSRHASAEELSVVLRHFRSEPDTVREQKLGNLFWSLVNTPEFNTNH